MAPQGSLASSLPLVCCPSNTLAPSASGPLHMQFLCLGCLPLLTSFTHGLLLREASLTPCVQPPPPALLYCFLWRLTSPYLFTCFGSLSWNADPVALGLGFVSRAWC